MVKKAAVLELVLAALSYTPSEYALADSESSSTQLQEVLVTATRRESVAQKTPISLSVVSEKDIQERGLADFSELAQSVPGVSMRTSGPGQTEFEMRGMSSFGGNSPTVGFYLDDVAVNGPAFNANGKVVIDPNLYDLNRVEVLRGPQGTLYGSSSMGGTIKLVPNAPNPKGFEASAETIFGGTDGGGFNHGENAMVNIPFASGAAALRIVGSESHDSGWIDRIVIANGEFPLETNGNGVIDPTGTVRGNVLAAPVAADYKGVNDVDLTSVRASVLWNPTDRLSITPSVYYQGISQSHGLSFIDSDPGTNAFYQPFDFGESFLDRYDLYSAKVQYRFDTFDVTSITAKWYRESDTLQDGSESIQGGLGLPSFYVGKGGIGPVPGFETDSTQQMSEEIRLASTTDSKFQWLVGYFYSDFHSEYDLFESAPQTYGTNDIFTLIQPVKIIQQAGFGELSYQLTPALKATAGLRRYVYEGSVTTGESGEYVSPPQNYYAYARNQGVNPKFTLSYDVSKDLLLYTTVAKGFRPGGGNQPVPTTGPGGPACEADLQAVYNTTSYVPTPEGFGPDSVWSYEFGEKMSALGGRLTVNSAAYYENWSELQQFVPLPCGFSFQANAGDAHIYGAELEIDAALSEGLTLSANAGYTHAFIATTALPYAGIEDGSPMLDVPNWTSAESLAYRHGISDQLTFMARVDNEFVGARTNLCYAVCNLPSYDLTNVRTGILGERWSAVLFVKNVFNKRALLNDTVSVNITLPDYNRVVVNQPLTFGIDLTYQFGAR